MISRKSLNIILIEPFYTGSHKLWADGYKRNSQHNIEILSLKGIYWKWRMHGGAITLAKLFNKYIQTNQFPDLVLITDMLNLPVFVSFANLEDIPIISFFHENQLTYPWSTKDRDKVKNRDHHYGFINYTTALRSNKIMFNSKFHKNSFLNALRIFLKQFPDHNELSSIDVIQDKSLVSYLGLDLKKFDQYKIKKQNKLPIILWNHRWEYDKNPEDFFQCLEHIKSKGIKFQLIIVGEEFDTEMNIFTHARTIFSKEIIHMGYCPSFQEYAHWLWAADILLVTTNQEFFGASIMEAMYCDIHPLLPNRLTYPELFNYGENRNNFYSDYEEMITKLENLLSSFHQSELSSFKKYTQQYDWSIISQKYDTIMSNIMIN